MSERDLDRLLASWLGDRTEATPDRVAEAALLQIATTPQDRAWLQRFVAWGTGSPGVLAATVLLALAIGLGVLVLPRLVGDNRPAPTPIASPSEPAPSDDPTAWVRLWNGRDGYEVTVPGRFGTPTRPHPGVISYNLDGRPFTISVGDPAGSLFVCGNGCVESTACQYVCQPIGRPIRTLDDLQELLISVPDPMGLAFREIHSDGQLGGLPARVESIAPGGYRLGPLAFYRVFALRDGRPVVLTFDFWSTRNGTINREEVVSIISSFRFLGDV